MATASRTVVIGSPSPVQAFTLLIGTPSLWWPTTPDTGSYDYSLDLTQPMTGASDSIAGVSVTICPSGSGELAASNISVYGDVITVWLSGGVPGRIYEIAFAITGVSTNPYNWVVGLLVDSDLEGYPIPDPPSTNFGSAVTWGGYVPSLDLTDKRNFSLWTFLGRFAGAFVPKT